MRQFRPRRSQAREPMMNSGSDTDALGRRHKPDYWLFVLSALLLTIGLVVVYSISPGLAASQHISQSYFITKQLIDVGLGLVAFGLAAYFPLKQWLKFTTPLALAAIAGCLIVMVTPIDQVYQAHRWIRLGGFSFQIAELVKLALLLWLARFLTDKWRSGKLAEPRSVLQPLLILLIAIGVVVAKFESDLGSAGVMISMMALMAYNAGLPMKRIALIGGAVALLLVVTIFSTSYRRDRLASFLHPGNNCQSTSYQACQALISVGSGGLFGQGLGYGVQAYGYLPEASNDSIFAIMAEKFGFIGTTLIVLLYGLFIRRLKNIIEHTADRVSRLLVVGVLAWLSTQMIINIGAMLGLLPLKGITLPLISQGGTSLVFLTAALGLVYQISRYTSYNEVELNYQNEKVINYSFNGRRLGGAHNPSAVARPRT
ncbi:MAG TPA: putative peptidoglycan glycosyltransferase FtsW [Candidatus Saccharimonadales bacterium]|nr:putative peptidoglycan glycosyltransferase FtsW [Candidatus Saccharimonadales bacterium]